MIDSSPLPIMVPIALRGRKEHKMARKVESGAGATVDGERMDGWRGGRANKGVERERERERESRAIRLKFQALCAHGMPSQPLPPPLPPPQSSVSSVSNECEAPISFCL